MQPSCRTRPGARVFIRRQIGREANGIKDNALDLIKEHTNADADFLRNAAVRSAKQRCGRRYRADVKRAIVKARDRLGADFSWVGVKTLPPKDRGHARTIVKRGGVSIGRCSAWGKRPRPTRTSRCGLFRRGNYMRRHAWRDPPHRPVVQSIIATNIGSRFQLLRGLAYRQTQG